MLQLNNIHYTIDGQLILRGVNWKLPSGEHALMLGASGGGKTTLLHIMAGLLQPTKGSVVLEGNDLQKMDVAGRDQFRGRHIGMVFQMLHLIPALKVKDNLKLSGYLSGKLVDDNRIAAILKKLKIEALADRFPHALSIGQAQRVAIARAVVNEPQFIFADEPTSALDDANAERTIVLLKEQAKNCGASLVVATHDARIMPHFKHRLSL